MVEDVKFKNNLLGVLALCFGFLALELLPISLWDLGSFAPFVIVFVILANFDKYIDIQIILVCIITGFLQDLATASFIGTWACVNLLTYLSALGFRYLVGIKLRLNIISGVICVALHMLAINIISLLFYNSFGVLEAIIPCFITLILIRPLGPLFAFGAQDNE